MNLKTVNIIPTVLFLFVSFVLIANARFDTIEDSALGVDNTLASETTEFGLPDSIVLGIINKPSIADFDVDFQTWYSGTYYYQVTRFGVPSISFHYVVSPDGELITNKNSQPERMINVDGIEFQNPILIGVFAQERELGIDIRLQSKLSEILLDIANKNAIPMEKIIIKDIQFEENTQRNLMINTKEPFGTWNNDLQKVKDGIKDKYSPVIKDYKVEVTGGPDLPQQELKVNETFDIKLKVKNVGETIIYGGSGGEFYLTLVDEQDKSKFYINDVWVSQTQARLMKDGEVLKIDEEKEYIIKAKAPLEIGEITENYKLINTAGVELTDKNLPLKVNLAKPEGKIIEISDTETGYLRVRETADFNSDEVERVSPGDRFFVLDSSNGFFQIDLGQDKKGWVYSKYIKSISP